MAKLNPSRVWIGKFDILATYTFAKALLHGVPEDDAKQRGMVAAIMGAHWRLDSPPWKAAGKKGTISTLSQRLVLL